MNTLAELALFALVLAVAFVAVQVAGDVLDEWRRR